MRQIGIGIFWLLLFITAAVPMSLAVIGWSIGRNDYLDRAKEVAQVAAPILTFLGFGVAAFVAYNTWLSPFDVLVQTRPFVWRIGPGAPPTGELNVVTYLTFFNRGATPGVVNNFLLEIELPKGKWLMEPFFFVRPGEFYQDSYRPEVKVPFDASVIEGPFTPIFLPGRTQVTKAVSFGRGLGANDFDFKFFEAGVHRIRLYARYNMESSLTTIMDDKIIFEQAAINDLNSGMTISQEVRQGDRPLRDLPRK